MVVGIQDGHPVCEAAPNFPFNPGPSLQFSELQGVRRGFEYDMPRNGRTRTIEELDFRVTARGNDLAIADMTGRTIDTTRSGNDIRFELRGYYFLVTLDPTRRTFVVRRCAGGPCK
jgi:hypothetical protein